MWKFWQSCSAGKVAEYQRQYIGFSVKQDQNYITVDHIKCMEKFESAEIGPLKAFQKTILLSGEETNFLQIYDGTNQHSPY